MQTKRGRTSQSGTGTDRGEGESEESLERRRHPGPDHWTQNGQLQPTGLEKQQQFLIFSYNIDMM